MPVTRIHIVALLLGVTLSVTPSLPFLTEGSAVWAGLEDDDKGKKKKGGKFRRFLGGLRSRDSADDDENTVSNNNSASSSSNGRRLQRRDAASTAIAMRANSNLIDNVDGIAPDDERRVLHGIGGAGFDMMAQRIKTSRIATALLDKYKVGNAPTEADFAMSTSTLSKLLQRGAAALATDEEGRMETGFLDSNTEMLRQGLALVPNKEQGAALLKLAEATDAQSPNDNINPLERLGAEDRILVRSYIAANRQAIGIVQPETNNILVALDIGLINDEDERQRSFAGGESVYDPPPMSIARPNDRTDDNDNDNEDGDTNN